MPDSPRPPARTHVDRRTVVRTAAWSIPAVSLATTAPAYAASGGAALAAHGTFNAPNVVGSIDGAIRNVYDPVKNNLRSSWQAPAWTGINMYSELAYQAFALTVTNPGIAAAGRSAHNAATDVRVTVTSRMDLTFTTGAEEENVNLRSTGWTYLGGTSGNDADGRPTWSFTFSCDNDIAGGTSQNLDFSLYSRGTGLYPGGIRVPLFSPQGRAVVTGKDATTGVSLQATPSLTHTTA